MLLNACFTVNVLKVKLCAKFVRLHGWTQMVVGDCRNLKSSYLFLRACTIHIRCRTPNSNNQCSFSAPYSLWQGFGTGDLDQVTPGGLLVTRDGNRWKYTRNASRHAIPFLLSLGFLWLSHYLCQEICNDIIQNLFLNFGFVCWF